MKPRINEMELACSAAMFKTSDSNTITLWHNTKEYETLLMQIAIAFGFSATESKELVGKVCLKGYQEKSLLDPEAKIELAKRIVHHCIHIISCRLFSQETKVMPLLSDVASEKQQLPSMLLRMPLSFRTVYILYHLIGFNEKEVAYILNINVFQVKERLRKAVG